MSSPETGSLLEDLRFARAYAAERLPWFAPALFRCRIVVTDQVKVAAIDRHYNIYWNPDAVRRIGGGRARLDALAELGFLWVHEISHLLRRHGDRAETLGIVGAEPERRWNIACDLEINDAKWAGLRMPAAYPGRFPEAMDLETGQLAEYYYRRIDAVPSAAQFPIDEGSGVHGRIRPWEAGGEQRLAPLDEELVRREVARLTREADQAGIPEAWRAWARSVLGSRVNWRQRLRHRMSLAVRKGQGAKTDYSYGRAHRRQSVYHPVLPPALSGTRSPHIAVVVDTSASMDDADLQRALTEIAAIIRQFDAPVTMIPCDVKDYEPVRLVSEREAFRINYLPGGSGTDLRRGIEAAVNLQPIPDTVLVITDGLTAYPAVAPRLPLVFAILGQAESYALPPNPPFTPDQVVVI
ncbi:putative metal-dependent peptidase [Neolewinella xylanilytica]|uniref:Putative metal-dependent peptidase n=1 Tax=Neolewinella xylanilytica TaxID=1514080 RepID=A0A2S6I5C0_9BACT|nr:VWA-like domain-containing protein [Neolewinella xylanilytica]PPK86367.1 putative metal-dependent peptidase [Neolewinella xylanilytica]